MTDNTSRLAELQARIESSRADWESHSSNASVGRWAGAASYLLTRDSGRFGRTAGTLGGIGGYMYGRNQSNKANAAERKIEADLQLALGLTKEACRRKVKIPSEIHQCVWMHNQALERALQRFQGHPQVLLTKNSCDIVVNPHHTAQMQVFLEFNRALCQVVSTLPKAEEVFNEMTSFQVSLDRVKLSQEITLSWIILVVSIILTFVGGVGIFMGIGWYVAHRYHGITPVVRSIRRELADFAARLNACGPIRIG